MSASFRIRCATQSYSAFRRRFLASVHFVWALVFLCVLLPNLTSGAQAQSAPGTWRAIDMTTASDNTSRLMWLLPDGRFAFWKLDGSGVRTQASVLHGPIAGWTIKSLGVGGDGLTRVLLVRSDGGAAVWTLDGNLNLATSSPLYGPFDGWSAIDFAVASDNSQRILWRHSSGMMGLWLISASGAVTMTPAHGPFTGWTPRALAVGGDGKTRVLWDNPNAGVSIWVMRGDGTHESILPTNGPHFGWTATDIAINTAPGSDNKCRVMLKRADGMVMLWKMSSDGASLETFTTHGPYAGWTPWALSVGGDGNMSALWLHEGGRADFWRVSPDGWGRTVLTAHGPLPLRVAAPANLSATAGTNRVTLSWNVVVGEEGAGVPGAVSYCVYRGTSSGTYGATPIGVSSTTAFVDESAAGGTTYFYVVRAVDAAGGESLNSNPVSVKPLAPPSAPTNLSATAGNAQVNLSWNGVTGATGYKVFRSTTSGTYTSTATGTSTTTSFVDTGVTNGTTYFYVVRATSVSGESAGSNQVSARPLPPPPSAPTLTATAGNAQVRLAWNSVTGATSYRLYLVDGGTLVTSTSALDFTHLGLSNGQSYSYVVVAQGLGGNSSPSNVASATPLAPPDVPAGLVAVAGNARVTLSWNASARATSYTLKRALVTGGPYTAIASNVSALSFVDESVTNGTTYFYVLSALGTGGPSANSSQASATPLAPPEALTGLTAQGGDLQVTLSWNTVAGASSYEIFRSEVADTFPATPLATTPNTSYTDTGLVVNTTYHYRVRAINASGAGEFAAVSITVYARLRFDARIASAGTDATGEGWIGGGVVNDSGDQQTLSQTVYAGQATLYRVAVNRSGGDGTSQRVHVTAPNWSEFIESGWSARFFDEWSGGADVTHLVTSAGGWQPLTFDEQEVKLRVEITAPETAVVGASQGLLVRVTEESSSETPTSDTVKAVAQVVSAPRPDALLRLTPPEGAEAAYIGNDVYKLDATQKLTRLTIPGAAVAFDLQIQNDGANAAPLQVKLPPAPAGWSITLFDALSNGTNISQMAQSSAGWRSPSLAPGESKELRLELKPSLASTTDASIRVLVSDETGQRADAVQAEATLQYLGGLEFSRDAGKTWAEVPAAGLQVPQWSVLGLRALRGNTNTPWPDEPFKPAWKRGTASHVGAEVWLHFPNVTPVGGAGEEVLCECGNSLSLRVRVLPEE